MAIMCYVTSSGMRIFLSLNALIIICTNYNFYYSNYDIPKMLAVLFYFLNHFIGLFLSPFGELKFQYIFCDQVIYDDDMFSEHCLTLYV